MHYSIPKLGGQVFGREHIDGHAQELFEFHLNLSHVHQRRVGRGVDQDVQITALMVIAVKHRAEHPGVAGAVALGRELVAEGRPDPQVVTILCDTGFRYLSTLYNADWLAAKGLPVFGWLARSEAGAA